MKLNVGEIVFDRYRSDIYGRFGYVSKMIKETDTCHVFWFTESAFTIQSITFVSKIILDY